MSPDLKQRYDTALHRMQAATGIATAHALHACRGLGRPITDADVENVVKHLRTGLNSSMASQAGLVSLLIEKGLFTQAEYGESMVVAAEREADERCADTILACSLPENTVFI